MWDRQRGLDDSHTWSIKNKDSESRDDVRVATVENIGGLEADADSSFELLRDTDNLADEYNYDYVDDAIWGDEEWTEAQHEKLEDYVEINAHVLCTPISIMTIILSIFFLTSIAELIVLLILFRSLRI